MMYVRNDSQFVRRYSRERRSATPIDETANDNFSASSHLIYDVPVMEETCDDPQIAAETRRKSYRAPRAVYGKRGRAFPRVSRAYRSAFFVLSCVSLAFPSFRPSIRATVISFR